MRYIIIEDEKLAADRLKKMVTEMKPDYRCVVTIDSVESAVISLPALSVDLIFMDIQLADGISFDIFDQISVDTPIIFTTAYDEFALKAFKSNSIDYLLKPIDPVELARALDKFEKQSLKTNEAFDQLIQSMQPQGKERFVVKIGEHLKTVETKDLKLIYSQDKATYLVDINNKKYLVDYALDKLENLLDKQNFFRISRKYIIKLDAIDDILTYSTSRLKINIKHYDDNEIIVSRERVQEFKTWLDR